jgi:hypothetical protein
MDKLAGSPAAYRRLIDRLDAADDEGARWQLLMAAHVVGQAELGLHWDSHRQMLRQAVRKRDAGEAAGQLLRLALVPLGHALGRLPAGNIGRATVSAFRPMEPPPPVAALIRWAWSARDAQEAADLS